MQVSSLEECDVTDLVSVTGVTSFESALAAPKEGNVDPLRSDSLYRRINVSNLLLAVNKCLTESNLSSDLSSPAIEISPISFIKSL